MHAINNLLQSACLKSLNLSSNMISSKGLEVIINTLNHHPTLLSLDLGVAPKSLHKNCLSI